MIKRILFQFIFFLAVLVLFVSAYVAPAQSRSPYIIKHYSIENGLPQSSAAGLALDHNGFLWISTQGGLCRFDGRRFSNYTSNNSMLPTERMSSLTVDQKGRVLVFAAKVEPSIFYINEHYRLLRDKDYDHHNFIFLMGHDPIKCDSILPCIDASGTQRTFRLKQFDFFSKANIFPLNDQQLYMYERDSLLWIDVHRKQFRSFNMQLRIGPVVNGHLLTFNDRWEPMIWKGPESVSKPQTTAGFKALQVRLRQHPVTRLLPFQNSGGAIGFICLQNEIWGVSLHNGLWDAFLIYGDLDPKLIVASLCYDEHNGMLFLGTFTDGFYAIRKAPFKTVLFDNIHGWKNNIYTLLRINDHTVIDWNYQYDPISGDRRPLPFLLNHSALFKSSDGRLWYSAKDTLYVADSDWVTQQKIPLAYPYVLIRAFMEEEDHTVWLCTDKALGYIDSNKLQRIALDSSYFSRNDFTTLFSFDRERLWLGTTDGIQVYNKKTRKIERSYLKNHTIRYIYRARDGSIWVSSYGQGIYRYLSGKWIPLPLDAGKCLLFAHCFVEDDNGFFWIPTNNGLFQCKKQALDAYTRQPENTAVYYYQHKLAGAYTDEYNGGWGQSFAWLNNVLFLASAKGIVYFNPLEVQPLLPNKEILIEDISVNGKAIDTLDGFQLPPGNQRLEINLAAPYFGDERNNILAYQLNEISQRWLPLTERAISYNSLPKGDYSLTIRKRTGFGSEDYAYKRIHFTVLPFWYETFWFWLVTVSCLSGIIYLLIRTRIRSLEGAKLQLEQKVTERTIELKTAVDDLYLSEQELNRINLVQEQALAIILHDIRSPLKYLSIWARQFNRDVHQLTMADIIQYSNSLALSTGSIDKLSEDLVQWLSFNRDNQKLYNEQIDLPALLQEIKSLYNEIAALGGNLIVVEKSEHKLVADRDKLYLIIRNLVDNAAKHCNRGQITLSGRSGADDVVITVSDTGNGMTEEELLRWRHYKTTPPDFKQGKLGLSMVYYFVQLMNGQLHVDSVIGKGTTVIIILPALPTHREQ